MTNFSMSVPTDTGLLTISLSAGSSLVFVGANGGGKTRLASQIEESLGLSAHRISAHRALNLDPGVPKISEKLASNGLRLGHAFEDLNVNHRKGHRWSSKAEISLLNDFNFVIQTLFAEQSNTALASHLTARSGSLDGIKPTKFEGLLDIWSRLLPHRQLHISGDDIQVSPTGESERYSASQMSDGERAIFYLIGQTLVVAENSVLIVDEPELHIHRSIMSKLWDELEAARPDCGFVYITHDLEFASGRVGQKFTIREYRADPQWKLEPVPEATGFDEETTTLILGSRRPVLFVEGDANSLDTALYRCCYPSWTVIPRGSCEQVIHSVVTMRSNETLTRVTCSGIVDADDYDNEDIQYLRRLGVAVLPVSEIENVILLPPVSRAIAESEGLEDAALTECLAGLQAAVFATVTMAGAIDEAVVRYCRRRIDRTLKKIDLSAAKDIAQIVNEYSHRTSTLDIRSIAVSAFARIQSAIDRQDLPALLANYDNKGFLALAATHLKRTRAKDFESWLTRILRGKKSAAVANAIREQLPVITPR
ncbi:ABC transporter ATP-binding protein [Paraburkholderia steynii]|uniref:ABC transporter ATP-binding protein n=1 Tax=Paraburkholderia steynii TaxID=1245441 RepID=A0A4R0XK31_9BURK|nr:ABC transporter ATP-binding protein [Paraburkholderia steynii]